jgi:cytochrome c biogenesis protein CcmG/thiol:disulfide interchange protein DsbE
MRRISFLFLCLLLCSLSALAQGAKVRINKLLLTREVAGWRVEFPDGAAGEYSLQPGDLLSEIDGRDAGRVGPLAVARAFNDAFSRAVQLTICRGSKLQEITLWRSEEPVPSPTPGSGNSFVAAEEEAPDFTLPSLNGAIVKLSSLRGKWVLISFWATWCTPCHEEAEILNQLARAYPQKLSVLALAVKDSRENLTAFSARIRPAYTILDAGALNAQPALSYGVGTPSGGGSVPVNVLVGPDGKIAYVQGGYVAPSPLEKQVGETLGGK